MYTSPSYIDREVITPTQGKFYVNQRGHDLFLVDMLAILIIDAPVIYNNQLQLKMWLQHRTTMETQPQPKLARVWCRL
jgi:hypothetical protein